MKKKIVGSDKEKGSPKSRSSAAPKKKPERMKRRNKREVTKVNNQRAIRNRAIREEDLRIKMDGASYLRHIENIDQEYDALYKEVHDTRVSAKSLAEIHEFNRKMSKVDAKLKILKQRENLNFKRLAKLLPDLKAIELAAPDGENPFQALAEAVAQKRASIHGSHPSLRPPLEVKAERVDESES